MKGDTSMRKRIELTEQIIEILENCSFSELEEPCGTCPLFGACLEYYTGDNSENQDKINKTIT